MLKAIVFQGYDAEAVGKKLDGFLEKNPNIKIVTKSQTDAGPIDCRRFVISIIYKPKKIKEEGDPPGYTFLKD